MGMNFTVSVTADFHTSLDADDIISRYDVDSDMLGISSDVSLDVTDISGSVDIEGTLEATDVEVEAVDLTDFDAEEALSGYGTSFDLSNVEFTITDSPTGFEAVEQALDRDTAIAVYAALANNGHEVV